MGHFEYFVSRLRRLIQFKPDQVSPLGGLNIDTFDLQGRNLLIETTFFPGNQYLLPHFDTIGRYLQNTNLNTRKKMRDLADE